MVNNLDQTEDLIYDSHYNSHVELGLPSVYAGEVS